MQIERITMFRFQLIVVCLLLLVYANAQQHPVTFFTKGEAAEVKKYIGKLPLLTQSFNSVKEEVDSYLEKDIDVPVPKDPAGGYTHDKHKANYTLMFNSGVLYNLTGNSKYAALTKNMLLKYAVLNPTLSKHPQATSSSPGRIFWQALNDANWMVYAGMAYDLIYNYLSSEERKLIEEGAFKPEVDYFTKDLKEWFSRLHNHSVWACAGVGMIGIASNNQAYVDIALYGIEKKGKTGFIAQMDQLFSPDGYYTEGPYYVRYAILPYMVFANAINNTNPSLQIFEHRNRILKKALITCLQQTNTNGAFFPLNDALKEKDYTTNEIVTAINISKKVYGAEEGFLTIAKKQNRVMLNKGGVAIAMEMLSKKNVSPFYPYKTIESADGVSGNNGGISIFRNGQEENLTSLIFKYASQGLGHGHFDRLNINLFDKGSEILQDYGSARFIGIEQKYGGRYLPENEGYAAQTIAHNTVVVDETSHFNGNSETGEKFHSVKLFSDISNPLALVVAAKEENAYSNIKLQRHLYMLQLPDGKKIITDIFAIAAAENHQYDLPFQYNGQFISTSFKYNSFINQQQTLGTKHGYQFLWNEAEAVVKNNTVSFTFLNSKSYYTVSSLIQDSAKIYFTRSGANDPNFNLRREPSFIIRKNGANQVFVNVLEIHGKYDAVNEFSTNAYTAVKQIKLLLHDDSYTVVSVIMQDKEIVVAQCNNQFGKTQKHKLTVANRQLEWSGPYVILYQGKQLK
jgi:oligo-alginate lyase